MNENMLLKYSYITTPKNTDIQQGSRQSVKRIYLYTEEDKEPKINISLVRIPLSTPCAMELKYVVIKIFVLT
jgi:hypothetical protein